MWKLLTFWHTSVWFLSPYYLNTDVNWFSQYPSWRYVFMLQIWKIFFWRGWKQTSSLKTCLSSNNWSKPWQQSSSFQSALICFFICQGDSWTTWKHLNPPTPQKCPSHLAWGNTEKKHFCAPFLKLSYHVSSKTRALQQARDRAGLAIAWMLSARRDRALNGVVGPMERYRHLAWC